MQSSTYSYLITSTSLYFTSSVKVKQGTLTRMRFRKKRYHSFYLVLENVSVSCSFSAHYCCINKSLMWKTKDGNCKKLKKTYSFQLFIPEFLRPFAVLGHLNFSFLFYILFLPNICWIHSFVWTDFPYRFCCIKA